LDKLGSGCRQAANFSVPDDLAIIQDLGEQRLGGMHVHPRVAEQLPVVSEPFDQQLSHRVGLVDMGQQFEIVSERPRFDEIDVGGSAEGADTTAWRERRDNTFGVCFKVRAGTESPPPCL
jgi:hypothetical protein